MRRPRAAGASARLPLQLSSCAPLHSWRRSRSCWSWTAEVRSHPHPTRMAWRGTDVTYLGSFMCKTRDPNQSHKDLAPTSRPHLQHYPPDDDGDPQLSNTKTHGGRLLKRTSSGAGGKFQSRRCMHAARGVSFFSSAKKARRRPSSRPDLSPDGFPGGPPT